MRGSFLAEMGNLVDGNEIAMQGREVVPSRPERNHASALQGALRRKKEGTEIWGACKAFVFLKYSP